MEPISDNKLEFEIGRFCLLIKSKLSRREFDAARDSAEELFRKEAEASFLRKTRTFKTYSRFLQRICLFLTGTAAALLVSMVLNIRPFLALKLEIIIVPIILLIVTVNVLLLRHYKRQALSLTERYERAKISFIEGIIHNTKDCTHRFEDADNILFDA